MIHIPKIKILEPRSELMLPVGLVGHYTLVVTNDFGESRVVAEFDNLITNHGLDMKGTHSGYTACRYCSVGTGTAEPAFTDTQLSARLATAVGSGYAVTSTPNTPYWQQGQTQYRFNPGVAVGNISEIGVGRLDTGLELFSRSLVKDSNGNNTTITVLADETLDVYYQLRKYQPLDDQPWALVISGVAYSGVIRPAMLPVNGYGNGPMSSGGYRAGIPIPPAAMGGTLSSSLGPVTGQPTGTGTGVGGLGQSISGAQSYVDRTYNAGSHYRDTDVVWGLDNGNVGGGIGAFLVVNSNHTWQMSVTPRIPKTNSKILKMVFRDGPWSRYTG